MIFVFDTTEFQDQKRLEGSFFRLFLVARNVARHEVCIPQIVVDEHSRHVRAAMHELFSTLESNAEELARYVGRTIDLQLPNLEAEQQRWDKWFVERLGQWGFEVLPYPSTSHADMLRRDLSRRKPFDEKGRGYRDALIWESVLELAAKSDQEVILVSRNASDFAKDGTLHPDLVHDLVARGIAPARVRWVQGLKAAVDTCLRSSLPAADTGLSEALARGAVGHLDVHAWLTSGLKSVCPRIKIVPAEHSAFGEEAILDAVKSVDHLAIKEARRICNGELFILFEATLGVKVRRQPGSHLSMTAASESTATSGTQLLTQFVHAMTALLVFDDTLQIDGALTFDAQGAVIASDIWEAVSVRQPFQLGSAGKRPR